MASKGPVPLGDAVAQVSIVPPTLLVLPGTTANFAVVITPPQGIDPARYPVYSGFINVASDEDTVKVSYLGVGGSLHDKEVLDTSSTFLGFPLPALVDAAGEPQTQAPVYTMRDQDIPIVFYRLVLRRVYRLIRSADN